MRFHGIRHPATINPIVSPTGGKRKVGSAQTTNFANGGSSEYGGFLERFALCMVLKPSRRQQTVSRRKQTVFFASAEA
ncbi:MAG: hypothetical protein U0744_18755 [Gemmataceae bacterium]